MPTQPIHVNATPGPSSPLWRAIGTEPGNGTEMLYIFEVDGEQRSMRQAVLACMGGVMSLDPDANRWRAMFPHPTRRGQFDLPSVVGFLMQQCRLAQKHRRVESNQAVGQPR